MEAAIVRLVDQADDSEDWGGLLDLCDMVTKDGVPGSKEVLKLIMKRVSGKEPSLALKAVKVLGLLVANCGKVLHLEICSRAWVEDIRGILKRSPSNLKENLIRLVKACVDIFGSDPQLQLMHIFYNEIRQSEGSPSADSGDHPEEYRSAYSIQRNQSNAPTVNDEDADLKRALELSLAEASANKAQTVMPVKVATAVPKLIQVKALYNFEAAEDNEISFDTGDIIIVHNDSDQSWWKGEIRGQVGLFPASFVTRDLQAPIPALVTGKVVSSGRKDAGGHARSTAEINEEQINVCLNMLKNASPTQEDDEEETIRSLEESCKAMGPLINMKIKERLSKKQELEDLMSKYQQTMEFFNKVMLEPTPTHTVPRVGPAEGYIPTAPTYSAPSITSMPPSQSQSGAGGTQPHWRQDAGLTRPTGVPQATPCYQVVTPPATPMQPVSLQPQTFSRAPGGPGILYGPPPGAPVVYPGYPPQPLPAVGGVRQVGMQPTGQMTYPGSGSASYG